MFFADHDPPHFHVLGRDGAAQVAAEEEGVVAESHRLLFLGGGADTDAHGLARTDTDVGAAAH